MIFNDEETEIKSVNAFYIIRKNSQDKYIEISSKNGISVSFNLYKEELNPQDLEKNKKIDLIKHMYWDVTLTTNETYYLFDITKDKVELVKLDDNLFNIKVYIKNPDMIYSPLYRNATFKNLIIDTNFSFIYDEK